MFSLSWLRVTHIVPLKLCYYEQCSTFPTVSRDQHKRFHSSVPGLSAPTLNGDLKNSFRRQEVKLFFLHSKNCIFSRSIDIIMPDNTSSWACTDPQAVSKSLSSPCPRQAVHLNTSVFANIPLCFSVPKQYRFLSVQLIKWNWKPLFSICPFSTWFSKWGIASPCKTFLSW